MQTGEKNSKSNLFFSNKPKFEVNEDLYTPI